MRMPYNPGMKIIQISSQFYVVREEADGKASLVAGPFSEAYWAASACGLRDLD